MGIYIERDAAVDALNKALFAYEYETEAQFKNEPELDISEWFLHRIFVQRMNGIDRQTILAIPAADVRPVVRGHWIGTKEAEDMGDIMKEFTCSVCGCCDWDCTESESFNFCPNCGARMDGE